MCSKQAQFQKLDSLPPMLSVCCYVTSPPGELTPPGGYSPGAPIWITSAETASHCESDFGSAISIGFDYKITPRAASTIY